MRKAETLQPEARSMILSYRSFGYSLESALADIIDNSITAGATEVRISTEFVGEDTAITITDDGCGMSCEELLEAMKLGCLPEHSYTKSNSKYDLGRFGHGMKTASFSQCKCLTVITKKNGIVSTRSWDLDFIAENGWQLIEKPLKYNYLLEGKDHGTVVVWEKMDRLVGGLKNNEQDSNKYASLLSTVSSHLSMTFHHFLERKSIQIYCFSPIPVTPFNPFLPEYSNLVETIREEERLGVKVVSYVMPNKSYIPNQQELRRASNGKGWVNMQGFYIYRSDRLLLNAGWMGLKFNGLTMKREPEYDLARIAIYLDNDKDNDILWSIDVKKSHAVIPATYREWLSNIAYECRQSASKAYRSRGAKKEKIQIQTNLSPLWKGMTIGKNGKRICKLNWENEMIVSLLDEVTPTLSKRIKTLLRLIEEYLPVESIAIEENKDDNIPLSQAFEGCSPEERENFYSAILNVFISKGYDEKSSKEFTKNILNI